MQILQSCYSHYWYSLAIMTCGCLGCQLGCTQAPPLVNQKVATTVELPKEDLPSLEFLQHLEESVSPASRPVAASAAMPSPGRTNPFEVAGDTDEQATSQESVGKRDIRITGFVELDVPTVMLLIDGKSHSFKSGESHQRITVNEISPPRIRLTYDSVTWTASLFDKHEK